MLKHRVITSLILAGLFFGSISFLPALILNIFFILIIAGAGREWAKLAGCSNPIIIFAYVSLILVMVWCIQQVIVFGDINSAELVQPLLGGSCFFWVLAFLWVKEYPRSAVTWNSLAVKSLMGIFLMIPLWLSVAFLFNLDHGRYFLTAFVILVAGADVGAYLIGKKIGRHTLIVNVSPNKTWEGVYGGVIFSLLLVICGWLFVPAEYQYLPLSSLMAITVITVLASIIGDLTVSMLKRETGLKDTGSLLPGHGGLLDRIDSFCSAAPVFALSVTIAL